MCPLRDQGTDQVCRELRKWIGRYGVPLKLHSDNGHRFISTEFQNFLDRYGIEHSYSAAYRPQANGSVERLNRTMGTVLSKLVTKRPRNWPDYLPEVQLAYNSSKHSSIKCSPYEASHYNWADSRKNLGVTSEYPAISKRPLFIFDTCGKLCNPFHDAGHLLIQVIVMMQ